MKKVFLLAVAFVLCLAGACLAGPQNFKLVNYTGKTIVELYVSPSKTDDWGENLAEEPIPHGEEGKVSFERNTERYWDLKIVHEDGGYTYWEGIDLFNIFKLTLRKNHVAQVN